MFSERFYDVVVVGGGPIGWATAYEIAKAGSSVMVLEQNNFFNQAGSSGDMARMFRTMYTEDFMADLAYEAMSMWDELEKDAGVSLRSMTGLLNFGDKDYGGDSPEGTLMGPIANLKRLKMDYKELTAKNIEQRYPFKDLPVDWIGLFAPDNGVINVPLLVRTLSRLAKDYGAEAHQYVQATKLEPDKSETRGWNTICLKKGTEHVEFKSKKVVLACGAYVNHVLEPSFDIRFHLDIWEMVATYYSVNPGPSGTVFPSMWFQFAPNKDNRSQLFYGFPTVEWGPPNLARIAVDAATRRICDPNDRQTNIISPEDIENTQQFVKDHVVGVDSTVPAFSLTCLQTNVYDNMFVLDFIPEEYLKGGAKDSIAVFTAGWAMKFVPLLGKALKEMVLCGQSKYARPEFSMTRRGEEPGESIITGAGAEAESFRASSSTHKAQAEGSSIRKARTAT